MPEKADELGALWDKTSGRGAQFMSGKLKLPDGQEYEVVVFRNSHKQEGERTPDWRIYKSAPREGSAPAPQQSGPHPQRGGSGRSVREDLSDDIPW